MILLAIIHIANPHRIWVLAKLTRFTHFLQQINQSVSHPFSKIQTRAPSLFPFVRCSNLHKSGSQEIFDWEGHWASIGFVLQYCTVVPGMRTTTITVLVFRNFIGKISFLVKFWWTHLAHQHQCRPSLTTHIKDHVSMIPRRVLSNLYDSLYRVLRFFHKYIEATLRIFYFGMLLVKFPLK